MGEHPHSHQGCQGLSYTLGLFVVDQGEWSKNGYRVSFRDTALKRTNIEQFRKWLLAEANDTQQELYRLTDSS